MSCLCDLLKPAATIFTDLYGIVGHMIHIKVLRCIAINSIQCDHRQKKGPLVWD